MISPPVFAVGYLVHNEYAKADGIRLTPMTEKHPTPKDWERAEKRSTPRAPRYSYCGDPGHRITACPKWLKDSSDGR